MDHSVYHNRQISDYSFTLTFISTPTAIYREFKKNKPLYFCPYFCKILIDFLKFFHRHTQQKTYNRIINKDHITR